MANETLNKVLSILTDAKDDIEYLFKEDPQGGHIEVTISSSLEKLISRFGLMAGAGMETKKTVDYPPITDFLGETIIVNQDLKEEDLNPTVSEKEAYFAHIDRLYDSIKTMSAEDVLQSYMNPDDVLVLRGVAYKAGLPDYETAPLTVQFIEAIKAGISSKDALQSDKAAFEAALKAETTKKPIVLSDAEKAAVAQDVKPEAEARAANPLAGTGFDAPAPGNDVLSAGAGTVVETSTPKATGGKK